VFLFIILKNILKHNSQNTKLAFEQQHWQEVYIELIILLAKRSFHGTGDPLTHPHDNLSNIDRDHQRNKVFQS
jgi:hypothetical protein